MGDDEVQIDDTASGTEFNFDAAPPSTDTAAPATSSGNPAWEEAYNVIPKEFQPQLSPIFEKWEKNTQTLAEKARQEALAPYQPYQTFVDQQVSPQEVLAAYQVWQQLNADPLTMYKRMEQALRETGQLPAEVQQAIEEEEALEEPQYQDPRVDQLQTQLEQLLNGIQQGQQQQEIQNYAAQLDQQIESEIGQIEQVAGGKMPDWLRLEVINRAAMMTDREQRNVPLMEAFQEFQQVRAAMLQNRPGANAPRVVPNGGGFPAPQAQPQGFGTLDERAERIKAIIEQNRT